MSVADFQCLQLLAGHYFRLAPVLQPPVALDDWREADVLVEAAMQVPLESATAWLQQNFT